MLYPQIHFHSQISCFFKFLLLTYFLAYLFYNQFLLILNLDIMGSQPLANVSNYMIMNHAISCHYNKLINTYGIWNRDPFKYTTPVLLMQVILIFVITRTLYVLLQPLHQTTIMVQIIVSLSFQLISRSYSFILSIISFIN